MITIAVCGQRGAGKSTVIQKLNNHLKNYYTISITDLNKDNTSNLTESSDISLLELNTKNIPQSKNHTIIIYVDARPELRVLRLLKNNSPGHKYINKDILDDYAALNLESEEIEDLRYKADIIIQNNKNSFDVNITYVLDFIANIMKKDNPHRKQPTFISPTFDASQAAKKMGTLYIVSGPSGVGKTTLIKDFINKNPQVERLVPYSTRAKRDSEKEGDPYRFISQVEFEKLISEQEFLQRFTDYGKEYGIPLKEVLDKLAEGKSLIIDVSTKVLSDIRQKIPNYKSIYICPAKMSTLLDRLSQRNGEQSNIEARYKNAMAELERACYLNYDYLIINDNYEEVFNKLSAIVQSNQSTLAEQQKDNASLFAKFRIYKILSDIIEQERLSFDIDDCQIQPLSSLNNFSYKITDGTTSYFLRIPRLKEDGYRILAEDENSNLTQAQQLGVYPAKVYYHKESCSYLASFLLEHQLLSDVKLKAASSLKKQVVGALIKLHQSALFKNDYNPLKLDEKILVELKQQRADLPEDIDNIGIICHRIADLLEKTCGKKVPCNNDISPFNLLYKEDTAYVVISDWECSGNNDPYWDLAKLSVESNFNQDEDKELLHLYIGNYSEVSLARLNLYKIQIEFHLGVWAKWQVAQNNTATSKERFESMFLTRIDNCRKHIYAENFDIYMEQVKHIAASANSSNFITLPKARMNFQGLREPSSNIEFRDTKLPQIDSIKFFKPIQNSLPSPVEQTLLILKPDMHAQKKIGAVISFIEELNFNLTAIKIKQLTKDDVYKLYPKIVTENICFDVMDLMTSGPIVLIVVEAENAAKRLIQLKGPTDPKQASAETATLRGKFGTDVKWNAVHCSDNVEAATREIALFFKPDELIGSEHNTYNMQQTFAKNLRC
jgi:guanylate kinase